ncbi:hypothetical protein CP09DC80_0717B, partial [Chlamydia psittaci 09DC80]
IAVRYKFLA